MLDILVALLAILFGAFCIFIGGCIFSEMPILFGVEFIVAGFSGILMILCGLMCFAVLTEM